jgi:hypothetical protein
VNQAFLTLFDGFLHIDRRWAPEVATVKINVCLHIDNNFRQNFVYHGQMVSVRRLSSFFAICLWVSAESNVEFAEPTIVNDGQGALISIFAPVLFSPLQVSSLPFSSLLFSNNKERSGQHATSNKQRATMSSEARNACVCGEGGIVLSECAKECQSCAHHERMWHPRETMNCLVACCMGW